MTSGSQKRSFTFHDLIMYAAVAGKHLRLVALLFSFCVLAALNYYVYVRPVYYCRAIAELEWVPRVNESGIDTNNRILTVLAELQSPRSLERTCHSLGIDEDARVLTKRFVPKVQISRIGKRAEIEVWATSLKLAKKYPERLVNEYLKFRQEDLARSREEIVQAYVKDMQRIDAKMDQTADERFERRKDQKIMETMIGLQEISDVPDQLVRITKRIDRLGHARTEVVNSTLDVVAKLSIIDACQNEDHLAVGQEVNTTHEDLLHSSGGKDPKETEKMNRVVVVPSMAENDSPWKQMERERIELKGQITDAMRIYRSGNHNVVALQKKLDVVERNLETEFQMASDHLGLELQDLLNRKHELEAKLPEYEQWTKQAARVVRDTGIFDASRLSLQGGYVGMKKELEELDFRGDHFPLGIKYVGCLVKDMPDSPNRGKLALFTIAFALMVSIGVPYLLEYLDHTLNNLDQVESTFQLRGLGIVPKLAETGRSTAMLINQEKGVENNLIENFRVIRTNLLSMGALSKPPHVMMVTSSMPKEGKTIVSSNLAISFSQTGARTLLMDTDLRRGRLHRLFGYRKSPGLSDVLMGTATLAEACRPTIYENLTILSAGKHLDSGTELLSSKHFEEIMAELRQTYSRIVVDTPPVLGLSETSVMQPLVDGVLFVIWSGKTPIRNMKTSMEMLYSNGANFYGFVLNRLDLSLTTNYYQYYYYSHDYYYHTTHALENA